MLFIYVYYNAVEIEAPTLFLFYRKENTKVGYKANNFLIQIYEYFIKSIYCIGSVAEWSKALGRIDSLL